MRQMAAAAAGINRPLEFPHDPPHHLRLACRPDRAFAGRGLVFELADLGDDAGAFDQKGDELVVDFVDLLAESG